MLKKSLLKLTIAAGIVAAAAVPAMADIASGTFTASMTVPKSCALDTSNASISLGVQDFHGSDIKSNSQLGVVCTKNTPYSIGLNSSTPQDNLGAGRMLPVSGPSGDYVPIQFYQDVNSTAKWGGDPSVVASGVGTGLAQALTVYVTAATANVEPADYSATITATVTY